MVPSPGRFCVGLVANRLGNRRLIQLGVLTALSGATIVAVPTLPAPATLMGLIIMGLGCAPIYPSMMHETARRFPPDVASTVIGRQIGLSYLGVSVMPAACGLLATAAGLVAVMPVVVLFLIGLLAVTEALNRMT